MTKSNTHLSKSERENAPISTVCMILPVISEYDKDLKSKHEGQRVVVWPILGVHQNHPSKIIQTVAFFGILLTVCMILGIQFIKKSIYVDYSHI
jgi:hypothetical protein